jgi:hypothetical protein
LNEPLGGIMEDCHSPNEALPYCTPSLSEATYRNYVQIWEKSSWYDSWKGRVSALIFSKLPLVKFDCPYCDRHIVSDFTCSYCSVRLPFERIFDPCPKCDRKQNVYVCPWCETGIILRTSYYDRMTYLGGKFHLGVLHGPFRLSFPSPHLAAIPMELYQTRHQLKDTQNALSQGREINRQLQKQVEALQEEVLKLEKEKASIAKSQKDTISELTRERDELARQLDKINAKLNAEHPSITRAKRNVKIIADLKALAKEDDEDTQAVVGVEVAALLTAASISAIEAQNEQEYDDDEYYEEDEE